MDKHSLLSEISLFANEALEKKQFIPGKTNIPATFPKLDATDVTTMADALLSMWWTEWKYAEKFKRALSEKTRHEYMNLCNSGSSANLVAVQAACKLYSNSSQKLVLTCSTGFPTTVAPIYQSGKIPLYIDIDPFTLCPRMDQIVYAYDKYWNDIAGAIFAHNLGFPFEGDNHYSYPSDKFLVLDSCDALGITTSTFANANTYSFFPAHIITTIEGGAIGTNNSEMDALVSSLINWGRSCYCKPGQSNTCGHRFDWCCNGEMPDDWDHKYLFTDLGYNLKITDIQAALGYSQIQRLDYFIAQRRWNYRYLTGGLLDLYDKELLANIDLVVGAVPFGFPIICFNGDTASRLIQYLEDRKISTRRFFAGNLMKQPGFMNLPYVSAGSSSGSDFVMNNMFWIGCHPSLTSEHLNYMIDVINDFFGV